MKIIKNEIEYNVELSTVENDKLKFFIKGSFYTFDKNLFSEELELLYDKTIDLYLEQMKGHS